MSDQPSWTKKQQKEHRKLWVRALRSGIYKQSKRALRNADNGYCCLGVACEVAMQNGLQIEVEIPDNSYNYYYDNECEYLPPSVRDFFGLNSDSGQYNINESLSYDNDELDYDFNKIADIIESKPKGLFK